MAAKKIFSSVLKSAGSSAILPSLPPWLYSTSSCFSKTTFGRTYYTAPSEGKEVNIDQVNTDRPLDTSNLDISRQPLMGMHGFDFERILFCSKRGFWCRKLLLEAEMRESYSLITLNVGTLHTGVSVWKHGMEDALAITTFSNRDMKPELMVLKRNYRPYGLIIGYPVGPDGGETPEYFSQAHVNQFIFNLESFLEFSGVPICLINEFGSSENLEEEVQALVRDDEANWEGEEPFVSTYELHKSQLAAKNLMIRFLETVAPDFLPEKYKSS